LNHGYKRFATGSTDNHNASGGDMGYPRTYVRMSTDEPRRADMDDLRSAVKAGRMIVSCGPFVEMKIGDAEIGDTFAVRGTSIAVETRVEAPSWMDVDAIDVILNGEVVQTLTVQESSDPVRFRESITVPVDSGRDGWLILRVRGDRDHGIWARNRPSFAFTNPIFLDGNADGAWVMP
jgi:hypothetical protein